MKSSEHVNEISDALAKAQVELKPPAKTKTAKVQTKAGGSYTFNYVDLADVLDSVRPALGSNGLSVMQGVGFCDGKPSLQTRLMHKGGQWVESEYPLKFDGDPQQRGSELTYARRYALCALLGIAAEDDDDGNVAAGNRAETAPRQSSDTRRHRDVQQPQRVAATRDGKVIDKTTGEVVPPPKASGRQVQELRALLEKAKAAGAANGDTAGKWHSKYGVKSFDELSSTDCMTLIRALRAKLDAAPNPAAA